MFRDERTSKSEKIKKRDERNSQEGRKYFYFEVFGSIFRRRGGEQILL